MITNLQTVLFAVGLLLVCVSFLGKFNPGSNRDLYLILIGGFLLRLMVSLDPGLHMWDERFHALVAKNFQYDICKPLLYKETPLDFNYQNWTSNHVWLHKQPLTLWLMALPIKVFGSHALSARIISILFSTACIYFTYKIGQLLFSKREGLLAAGLLAINGFVIEHAGGRIATDHIDTGFVFFIEVGIFLTVWLWKQNTMGRFDTLAWAAMIGILTGLAVLSKWLPGLIVFPIFLLTRYGKNYFIQQVGVFILAACMVILPWQIYAAIHFPSEYWFEFGYNMAHITKVIEDHSHPWYFYLEHARINWNELIYIPLAWLIYYLVSRKRHDGGIIILALWILIPYLVFSLAKTKMSGYVLFTAPALFLLTAYFIYNPIAKLKGYIGSVFLIAFICLGIRYSVERCKPFYDWSKVESPALMAKALTEFVSTEGIYKKVVFCNTPYYIDMMFYTDYIAYERVPAVEEINLLLNQNYALVILDENLPEQIRNISGIHLFRFKRQ